MAPRGEGSDGTLRWVVVTKLPHKRESVARFWKMRQRSLHSGRSVVTDSAVRPPTCDAHTAGPTVRSEVLVPAMSWATEHRLPLPFSALVIYDSFIHSGSTRVDGGGERMARR